jgi:hypothetical protein
VLDDLGSFAMALYDVGPVNSFGVSHMTKSVVELFEVVFTLLGLLGSVINQSKINIHSYQ